MTPIFARHRGESVQLNVGPLGLSLLKAHSSSLIPWGDVHFVDFPKPGTMTVTVVQPGGDHHDLIFHAALAPVTEDLFERLAAKYR